MNHAHRPRLSQGVATLEYVSVFPEMTSLTRAVDEVPSVIYEIGLAVPIWKGPFVVKSYPVRLVEPAAQLMSAAVRAIVLEPKFTT
jgi:hypothetical protein